MVFTGLISSSLLKTRGHRAKHDPSEAAGNGHAALTMEDGGGTKGQKRE